jgi:GT2 family glycosyltransferase
MKGPFTAAVVIPARNEARRLPACLSALLPQIGRDVLVVVVANNCTDATAAAARAVIPGESLVVIECTLDAAQGVGEARRRGCAHATRLHPDIALLLSTDADCITAPDWIARNREHLGEVDAVCGLVEPMPSECEVLRRMRTQTVEQEAAYRDLVLRFYDLFAPEPHNPYPHHGGAPGASMACRAAALRHVGNFADLRTGEDRDLIRRMRARGLRVRHASDVRVQASCRLTGRAPGGWADTLRHRLTEPDFLVDEGLPPVACLLDMAGRGALATWPPHLPDRDRLHPHDLPGEIALLRRVLARQELGQALWAPFQSSHSPTGSHEHGQGLVRAELQEARLRHPAHDRRGPNGHDDAHDENGRPLDAHAGRNHANGARAAGDVCNLGDARGGEGACAQRACGGSPEGWRGPCPTSRGR